MVKMEQAVQVKCPGCATLLRLPADSLGQPLRCGHCKMTFQAQVPAPSIPAPNFVPKYHAPRRPWAYELLFAFAAIAAITVWYVLLAAEAGAPSASSLLGHSLGIVGFLMMLSTE